MKQIASYQIQLGKQHITMEEMMNIYRFVSQSSYDVYLYQNDLIADASNLPKLLSFFMYSDKESSILMIIDGENVEYAYQKILKICEEPIEECLMRNTHITDENAAIQV